MEFKMNFSFVSLLSISTILLCQEASLAMREETNKPIASAPKPTSRLAKYSMTGKEYKAKLRKKEQKRRDPKAQSPINIFSNLTLYSNEELARAEAIGTPPVDRRHSTGTGMKRSLSQSFSQHLSTEAEDYESFLDDI